MAYGKDIRVLGDVGTFRQGVKAFQSSRERPAKSGGGARPYFLDRFQPSTDDPDQIRVLKGSHEFETGSYDGSITKQTLHYFPYVEHYHATLKKGFICSAGPFKDVKGQAAPCMGCDMYWSDRSAGRKNGAMSRREMFSFSILHYAQYAKIEQRDRATGTVKTNSEGQPFFEWQRVHSYERSKFAGKEMIDARVLHWDMGLSHWKALTEYDKEIGKSCKSCGGRDTVRMVAWTCRNCGEALIDGDTTTYSPREIDDLSGHEATCPACRHTGYMLEYVECSNCPNGQRAEIFDVDLHVKRIADPKGGNQTSLAITSWSNPRPIDQRFVEIAKPMDLPKVLQALPYEKQEEKLGGTRTPVTPEMHARPYGSGPSY